MYHDFNFASVLAASARAAWQIDDVLPTGAALDFTRPFMPETLARTGAAAGLSADERRVLNQIRGHEYLVIFGLVEEFILPFVLDHARPQLNGDRPNRSHFIPRGPCPHGWRTSERPRASGRAAVRRAAGFGRRARSRAPTRPREIALAGARPADRSLA